LFTGTTKGGSSRVSAYRYPTAGDVRYAGPERIYTLSVRGSPANVGAVVLSGKATPHVVFAGHDDHLAGYAGLPIDLNPYRASYGRAVRVAGAILPGAARYDLVFDTRSAAAAGPFTFRYWVNDVTPPHLKATSGAGTVLVNATDGGSGIDPSSVIALLDGKRVTPSLTGSSFGITAAKGRHTVVFQVSDYQESKNMEDVAPILPNTAVLRTTVTVR
jgi:hypothetical protein